MKIGEILIESALINTKQLDEGLYYGRIKGLPLGRCLKILGSITEENLTRALEAQKLIRGGLDGTQAIEVLKTACEKNKTFHEELKKRSPSDDDKTIEGPVASSIYSMAITFPDIAPLAPSKDYRQPTDS